MRARAGLEAFAEVGTELFRGAHQRDGLFDGSALLLNGTTLYSLTSAGVVTAFSGSILGDDYVDLASGQDSDLNSVARIATGSALYKAQDGVVTLEDFPEAGGAGASSVCYHRGYWLAVEAGTDKVYIQIPGDTTWDPLTFASAEYSPDPLVAVRSRGDQIALLGSSTFEVFTLSGDASNPIVPYGGLVFDHGCRARATAVNCKGSLLYVDNECNVRRWDGGEPVVVSGPGLAEQIRGVSAMDLRAWTYATDGHLFYLPTLGATATWVYDLNGVGERWTTRNSLGYAYWRAHLGCSIGDVVLACDFISETVWRLDRDRRTDDETVFETKFCAVVEGEAVSQNCANVALLCDLGDVPRTGQGSAPVITLRLSDDQGKTFGPLMEQPLAVTGDYSSFPQWNGLGDIPRLFGRIFEFSVSDPVGRVFKRVFMNI